MTTGRIVMLFTMLTTGCGGVGISTTVLPPHRLEAPICPKAVMIHQSPAEVPPGTRVIARLRATDVSVGTSRDKILKRMQVEAAKLGANRLLAAEVTTPSTLAALGMMAAEGTVGSGIDDARTGALQDPRTAPTATSPVPKDASFYGRGIAYALFFPPDTFRVAYECSH